MKLRRRQLGFGFLNIELAIALTVLVVVLLPMAFGFHQEARAMRTLYRDAVAMEIIDGEMEVLAAGEWKKISSGTSSYQPRANSITNLPPGKFFVTRDEKNIRLEWLPERGRKMKREVKLP